MKKSLSLLLGTALPSLFLVLGACGDDVVDAEPTDTDSGRDASRQQETTLPKPDGGGDADAKADSSTTDADADSPDGDAGDAGDVDGGRLYTPTTFVRALAISYCSNYSTCCKADDPYLAPANTPTCMESIDDPAFFSTGPGKVFFSGLLASYYFNANVATSSHAFVDDALAVACLTQANALGCVRNPGEVAAADWKSVIETCSLAMHGDGLEGDPCFSSIECATDFACQGATEGAATRLGTCKAFQTVNESIVSTGEFFNDSCSYRGLGAITGLHGSYTATGDRCLPQSPLGGKCRPGDPEDFAGLDVNCASGACSLNNDDENLATDNVCSSFKYDPYICGSFGL